MVSNITYIVIHTSCGLKQTKKYIDGIIKNIMTPGLTYKNYNYTDE